MSGTLDGALVNPLSAINREAHDAEHGTAVNLGITALTERARVLRTELDRAVDEAGENFDVGRVTGDLKGDTPTATLGNLVDHQSCLLYTSPSPRD